MKLLAVHFTREPNGTVTVRTVTKSDAGNLLSSFRNCNDSKSAKAAVKDLLREAAVLSSEVLEEEVTPIRKSK